MTKVDPQIITEIDTSGQACLHKDILLAEAKQRYEAAIAPLTRAYEDEVRQINQVADGSASTVWRIITKHRSSLMATGKKSFATMHATFQLREVPAKITIVDKKGVMRVARRLGVVKHIANPPKGGWTIDQKKFMAWIAHNSELRAQFEPFIDEVEARESLTIKPNAGHTVIHDRKRISPPPVTVPRKELDP